MNCIPQIFNEPLQSNLEWENGSVNTHWEPELHKNNPGTNITLCRLTVGLRILTILSLELDHLELATQSRQVSELQVQ